HGVARHGPRCALRRPRVEPGREVRRRRAARLPAAGDGRQEGDRGGRAGGPAPARPGEARAAAGGRGGRRPRALERPALRRLGKRRLLGLDRSGPPPPETLPGAPLRPWTIPNAIGYARLALIPVFLVLALGSGDGRY